MNDKHNSNIPENSGGETDRQEASSGDGVTVLVWTDNSDGSRSYSEYELGKSGDFEHVKNAVVPSGSDGGHDYYLYERGPAPEAAADNGIHFYAGRRRPTVRRADYALYGTLILCIFGFLTRYLLEFTPWLDGLMEFNAFRSGMTYWLITLILPAAVLAVDTLIENKRTITGSICAVLLPFLSVCTYCLCGKEPLVGLAVAVFCTVAFLLLVMVKFSINCGRKRRRFGPRIASVLTSMKRVAVFTEAAAIAVLGICTLGRISFERDFPVTIAASSSVPGSEFSTRCEVYREPLSRLNPDTWMHLNERSKLETIQCAVNIEATGLNLSYPVSVCAADLYREAPSKYESGSHIILLDHDIVRSSDYDACLQAALSGLRTAFQCNVVEAYESLDSDYRPLAEYNDAAFAWSLEQSAHPVAGKLVRLDSLGVPDSMSDAETYAKNARLAYETLVLDWCIADGDAVSSRSLGLNSRDVRLVCFPEHLIVTDDSGFSITFDCYSFRQSSEEFDSPEEIAASFRSVDVNNDRYDDIMFTIGANDFPLVYDSDSGEYSFIDYLNELILKDIRLNWESNPIDRFFETWIPDGRICDIADYTAYELARESAWQAEVVNAYTLLRSCADASQTLTAAQIDASLTSFLRYAADSTNVDVAALGISPVDESDETDNVKIAAAFGKECTAYRAALYRTEALRVYALAEEHSEITDVDSAFVFDADKFYDELVSSYDIPLAYSETY